MEFPHHYFDPQFFTFFHHLFYLLLTQSKKNSFLTATSHWIEVFYGGLSSLQRLILRFSLLEKAAAQCTSSYLLKNVPLSRWTLTYEYVLCHFVRYSEGHTAGQRPRRQTCCTLVVEIGIFYARNLIYYCCWNQTIKIE